MEKPSEQNSYPLACLLPNDNAAGRSRVPYGEDCVSWQIMRFAGDGRVCDSPCQPMMAILLQAVHHVLIASSHSRHQIVSLHAPPCPLRTNP